MPANVRALASRSGEDTRERGVNTRSARGIRSGAEAALPLGVGTQSAQEVLIQLYPDVAFFKK